MINKFISKIDRLFEKLRYKFKKREISELNLIEDFPIFTAHGAGSYENRAKLTMQSINKSILALSKLSKKNKKNISFESELQNIFSKKDNDNDLKLKKLFKDYGSDKSTVNNYYKIYSYLIKSTDKPKKIFEIGLGTNNADIVSTMGIHGKPGASLRAFRDFDEDCKIYGADFDQRVLFNEDRIQTYFVDQTKLKTFKDLSLKIGSDFDLMIDDGLHSPYANLNSLNFFLNNIICGGYAVIEDVNIYTKPIWNIVSQLIETNFSSTIIETKATYMFIVRRDK